MIEGTHEDHYNEAIKGITEIANSVETTNAFVVGEKGKFEFVVGYKYKLFNSKFEN